MTHWDEKPTWLATIMLLAGHAADELLEALRHPQAQHLAGLAKAEIEGAMRKGIARQEPGGVGAVVPDVAMPECHERLASGVSHIAEIELCGLSSDERRTIDRLAACYLEAERVRLTWADLTSWERLLVEPICLDIVRGNGWISATDPCVPVDGNKLDQRLNLIVWWGRTGGKTPAWFSETRAKTGAPTDDCAPDLSGSGCQAPTGGNWRN